MTNKYAEQRPPRSQSDRNTRYSRASVNRARTCISKRGHAQAVAEQLARERDQRAYQCPYCNRWHLTTQKGDEA